jgi:hypothetical protein
LISYGYICRSKNANGRIKIYVLGKFIMKKSLLDVSAVLTIAAFGSMPALAGALVPAPVAGVGIGALVVLGLGYRALRKRIDR